MMILGLLGSVNNLKIDVGLNGSSTLITWDPPFSLDLTNIHPDVIYCVDIYNITCGIAQHLVSDCDVVVLYYTFYSEDEVHKFIVTPKSNVANSRNGTTSFQSGIIRYSSTNTLLCQLAYESYFSMRLH